MSYVALDIGEAETEVRRLCIICDINNTCKSPRTATKTLWNSLNKSLPIHLSTIATVKANHQMLQFLLDWFSGCQHQWTDDLSFNSPFPHSCAISWVGRHEKRLEKINFTGHLSLVRHYIFLFYFLMKFHMRLGIWNCWLVPQSPLDYMQFCLWTSTSCPIAGIPLFATHPDSTFVMEVGICLLVDIPHVRDWSVNN